MKRVLLGTLLVGAAAFLGGCPIYPSEPSSYDQCETDADCGAGYACGSQGECVPLGTGYDASAPNGCGSCPSGTVCTLVGGAIQCLPPGDVGLGGDASTTSEDASSANEASVSDGGVVDVVWHPSADAAAGSETGTGSGLCNADSDCVGAAGSKCIDGLCTPQSGLCSDGTQCLAAGESCVDGLCIPPCGGSAPPCPAGYACDFTRDVCSVNPSACSSTNSCQGGAVCVETRCVAPCAPADAGPQCAAGQVCVNGGCIPDQQARFACQNDGNQGSLADSCDPSSLCLHGDCYAACDTEASGCAAPGESCKSVTIAKGTYSVCGTATNLGSDCNPAVGDYCASPEMCIDGYCK